MLLHVQQAQGARHQHAVDVRVHLREIGGLERHGDAEVRQRIRQCLAAFIQQLHRVGPLGLQPPLHVVLRGKGAQAGNVFGRQGLQVAQHQGRDVVAAGQLNLRAGVARIHVGHQLAQRHQHGADVGRQHGADFHVGHVAALALVKAHQHRALFDDVAHSQAGAVAVAPGGALDRAQDGFGLHLAQVPEVVLQRPLLDGHLGARVQVLHLATAAGTAVQAKVRAAGAHALGGLAVDVRQAGLFPVVLFAVGVGADPLERQGTINEDHLTVGLAGHALGIQVHGLDGKPALGKIGLVCGVLKGWGEWFGLFAHPPIVSGSRPGSAAVGAAVLDWQGNGRRLARTHRQLVDGEFTAVQVEREDQLATRGNLGQRLVQGVRHVYRWLGGAVDQFTVGCIDLIAGSRRHGTE